MLFQHQQIICQAWIWYFNDYHSDLSFQSYSDRAAASEDFSTESAAWAWREFSPSWCRCCQQGDMVCVCSFVIFSSCREHCRDILFYREHFCDILVLSWTLSWYSRSIVNTFVIFSFYLEHFHDILVPSWTLSWYPRSIVKTFVIFSFYREHFRDILVLSWTLSWYSRSIVNTCITDHRYQQIIAVSTSTHHQQIISLRPYRTLFSLHSAWSV
jgi:hypothetical protein